MLDNEGRRTHNQNIYILLAAFHGNNGHTKTRFGTTRHLPGINVKETTVRRNAQCGLKFNKIY
jgi:hypothetical protein